MIKYVKLFIRSYSLKILVIYIAVVSNFSKHFYVHTSSEQLPENCIKKEKIQILEFQISQSQYSSFWASFKIGFCWMLYN